MGFPITVSVTASQEPVSWKGFIENVTSGVLSVDFEFDGKSALHHSVTMLDYDFATELMYRGANLNQLTVDGGTLVDSLFSWANAERDQSEINACMGISERMLKAFTVYTPRKIEYEVPMWKRMNPAIAERIAHFIDQFPEVKMLLDV
jgi:hypothetical protein